ncbi:flagellar hook-associated protein FlgL [Spirochaetia bacterium]|nr:flagellar hook-associated protein FlgL [Spirochaetia bacterium]
MRRVSTNMPNTDMQYYLQRQEEGRNNIQSKIAKQTKILELRDDPLAASHAVRYDSYLARLKRFEDNALYAREHYQATHDYLYATTDVLQRIRDLSVQGANGIYTQDDMKNMASEVNYLIKELVSLSNSTDPDGKQVFAGDKVFTEPFRAVEGTVPGGGESMVVRVEYRGTGASRKTEVTDGVYSELDIGGGEAFWAEKMQVLSTTDATDYRAAADGAFFVDGVEIPVNTGDTLHAIVAKINDSSAPVKAYVDPETRGLALEGTNAHLIRMEDRQDSSVLRNLGIIQQNSETNAPNWSNTARVSGGSVFDMAIRLRDALYRGDQDFVGSQGIGGIDLALNNVTARLADISSRSERADMTWKRLNQEIPDVTAQLSREIGLDLATAAMELAQMDLAHKASLQVAAKILPTTLLDFLR